MEPSPPRSFAGAPRGRKRGRSYVQIRTCHTRRADQTRARPAPETLLLPSLSYPLWRISPDPPLPSVRLNLPCDMSLRANHRKREAPLCGVFRSQPVPLSALLPTPFRSMSAGHSNSTGYGHWPPSLSILGGRRGALPQPEGFESGPENRAESTDLLARTSHEWWAE